MTRSVRHYVQFNPSTARRQQRRWALFGGSSRGYVVSHAARAARVFDPVRVADIRGGGQNRLLCHM